MDRDIFNVKVTLEVIFGGLSRLLRHYFCYVCSAVLNQVLHDYPSANSCALEEIPLENL